MRAEPSRNSAFRADDSVASSPAITGFGGESLRPIRPQRSTRTAAQSPDRETGANGVRSRYDGFVLCIVARRRQRYRSEKRRSNVGPCREWNARFEEKYENRRRERVSTGTDKSSDRVGTIESEAVRLCSDEAGDRFTGVRFAECDKE